MRLWNNIRLAWLVITGGMKFAERWRRDDNRTHDILSLTGQGSLVPPEAIAGWTNTECKAAEDWAGASHLHASDNDDVAVPPIPRHVAIHDTEENRRRRDVEEQAFWDAAYQRGKGARP
jgi:hypothetical protein